MDKKKDSLRGFHPIPKVLEKPLRDSKLMDKRNKDEALMITSEELSTYSSWYKIEGTLYID